MPVPVDGAEQPMWAPIDVPAGATLTIGTTHGPGLRATLAVRGGIDTTPFLGSRSTFTLGRFGGHEGRALCAGDVLPLGAEVVGRAGAVAPGHGPRTAVTRGVSGCSSARTAPPS